MEESRPRMVNSSSASHDDEDMSLMTGDVCSWCAQASIEKGVFTKCEYGGGFQ